MDQNNNNWRKVGQKDKFMNAFRGLYVFFMTTRNLYIHLTIALIVVFFGFYFKVSQIEWLVLVFAIGFVLVAEAFNTAIEIDIDLTSPEYHPYARDTKDVAAAAVLLATLTSIVIGLIVFLPKFF